MSHAATDSIERSERPALSALAQSPCSLILGDCLEVMQDLPDKSVDAIITDPPYGIGKAEWDSRVPTEAMPEMERILKPGGALVIFGLPPFVWEWHRVAKETRLARELYWWHDNGYPGNNFRLATESVLYMVKGKRPLYWGGNSIREPYAPRKERPMGRPDRQHPDGKSPGNVLRFPRVAPNHKDYTGHPTAKPTALMRHLVLAVCEVGGIVLDPFCGCGTTCLAAKLEGRRYIGIEREPKYFETAKTRIEGDADLFSANVKAVPAAAGGSESTQEPSPPLGTSA